ncbi:MAG: NADPH-dependent 7-cyano-7-deazaguanine reductase QueF [Bacteroidales bacterium]|nr:NADPH-dependent 7-cyano-7-deazaguanine reductase QueF [Bacteroidales bacterium]
MPDQRNEERFLGKRVITPESYDPTLLVAVPRAENRRENGIDEMAYLFEGYDVWHAYETSFLLENGLPVTGITKIVYPASSPNIVESKSLKLYMNSLNNERLGESKTEAISDFEQRVQKDLEKIVEDSVWLKFHDIHTRKAKNELEGYQTLEDEDFAESLTFSGLKQENITLGTQPLNGMIKWKSHLLRSNCKITFQPDWGTAFIRIEGEKTITPKSILEFIVSMRNENHFHEEIAEMMFKRFYEKVQPGNLTIACIYTRRGGIDITPVRSNNLPGEFDALTDPAQLVEKIFRQ